MYSQCCVTTCKNKTSVDDKNGVSFFEFPSTPTRKRNWLEKIARPYFCPVRTSRICSKHFNSKDLVLNGSKVILDKRAEPLPLATKIISRRNTRNSLRVAQQNISLNNIVSNTSLNNIKRVKPNSSFSVPETVSRRVTRSSLDASKENISPNKRKRVNSKRSDSVPEIVSHRVTLSSSEILKENISLNNSVSNISLNNSVSNISLNKSKRVKPNRSNSIPEIVSHRVTRSSLDVSRENISPNKRKRVKPNRSNSIPEIVSHRVTRSLDVSRENISPNKRKRVKPNNSNSVPEIVSRRVTRSSLDVSNENISLNNNKRVERNSSNLVPENSIKRRRNSVFIGTYDFGIRKKAPTVTGASKSRVTKKIMPALPSNQSSIRDFLIQNKSSTPVQKDQRPTISGIEDCIFGWTLIGSEYIPYIVRNSEKYCALRMIVTALAKYQNKYLQISSFKTNVECYDPTVIQCKLLTEINSQHCDFAYGRAPFTSTHKLVRLSDAIKYVTFCSITQLNGTKVSTEGLEFGFTLVDKKAYIPYIVYDERKFIPLIYLHCDGEILEFLKERTHNIFGGDALFLKLCCKYDGIVGLHESIEIIDLAVIQQLAPKKTTFKDCWPTGQINYELQVRQTTKGLRLDYIKKAAARGHNL